MRAEVSEGKRQNLPYVIVRCAGYTDAACASECLQPCCDVDAIAKEVAALHHNIADVHSNPEVDATLRRDLIIRNCQRSLRLNRALKGIDDTPELRQYAVPGGIGDPATMRGNQGVHHQPTLGQIPERSDFVGPHQAAVTLDICRENRD
jgi:hypothetical protein